MNFSSYVEENLREEICKHESNFTKATPEYVNIYFFYVINNQCDEYMKEVVSLTNGVLTKETLLAEIVKKRNEGRRFNIGGIYGYHFNVDDLADFVENGDKGFTEYTDIDAINYAPSVDYFQHHNSLFVFLTNEKNKHTKKTNIPTKRRSTLKSS
jgi:hypothetical protein